MISDKRMDELIDRADQVARRCPEGAYASVFHGVLSHLVENESQRIAGEGQTGEVKPKE